jgi:hypothetical protein
MLRLRLKLKLKRSVDDGSAFMSAGVESVENK